MSVSDAPVSCIPHPYVRVYPDWESVVSERLDGPSPSGPERPQNAASLEFKLHPDMAHQPPRSIWLSAYKFGGADYDDTVEIDWVKLPNPTPDSQAGGSGAVLSSVRMRGAASPFTVELGHRRRMSVRYSRWATTLQAPIRVYKPSKPEPGPEPGHVPPAAKAKPGARRWPVISTLAVSGDGRLGASGSDQGQLNVWNAADGSHVHDLQDSDNASARLRGHVGDVTALRFFPSDAVLLSGGADHLIKIWSIEAGACAQTLSKHERSITGLDMLGRGRHIVSSSLDGTAKLWDCARTDPLVNFAVGPSINDCLLAEAGPTGSEGSTFLVACSNGSVQAFDVRVPAETGAGVGAGAASTAPVFDLGSGSRYAVTRLALAADGHVVYTGDEVGFVRGFDLRRVGAGSAASAGPAQVSVFRKNEAAVTALLATRRALIMGSAEGDLTLWDVSGAAAAIVTEFTGADLDAVTGAALRGGEKDRLLFSAGGSDVRVYDITNDADAATRNLLL